MQARESPLKSQKMKRSQRRLMLLQTAKKTMVVKISTLGRVSSIRLLPKNRRTL